MTSPPPVVPDRPDVRTDPVMLGAERQVLDGWLELYRETVLLKIAGLDADQLAMRSVPPSTLSLIGVVRHLSFVERYWVRTVLQGEADLADLYCTADAPDADFEQAHAGSAADDVAIHESEVSTTHAILAEWSDLAAVARGRRRGKEVNLRWILVHLIEEHARHLGHMDLLRETIDGRTGY